MRRQLEIGGGTLEGSSEGAIQLAYYQATRTERMTVTQAREVVAELLFPPVARSTCERFRAPNIAASRCGYLQRVRWLTPVRGPASSVAEVDVNVRSDAGKALGFMLWKQFDARGRLGLDFSYPDAAGAEAVHIWRIVRTVGDRVQQSDPHIRVTIG